MDGEEGGREGCGGEGGGKNHSYSVDYDGDSQ